jgi:hypothetical protein
MNIGTARALAFILTVAQPALALPRVDTLNPRKLEDRALLVQIAQQSAQDEEANIESHKAAKVLSDSGQIGQLLPILETTARYDVMGTIAQTRNEAIIPVFEKRLQKEPRNAYLVGALAYVQSPKACPILSTLLRQPENMDITGPVLNALAFNSCLRVQPDIRDRFTSSKSERLKTEYALTLIALGDGTPSSWLADELTNDHSTGSAGRIKEHLATLAAWNLQRSSFLNIQDEEILKPLLSPLVSCAGDQDCSNTLRDLTRYDLRNKSAWIEWYEKHKARHPIYSKPLDGALKKSLATFRNALKEAGQQNAAAKEAGAFLPPEEYGGISSFLWKLESHPEFSAALPTQGGRVPPKEFGLSFQIAMTSKVKTSPPDTLFRRDFNKINISVILSSPARDEALKNSLIFAARSACEPISNYEASYNH